MFIICYIRVIIIHVAVFGENCAHIHTYTRYAYGYSAGGPVVLLLLPALMWKQENLLLGLRPPKLGRKPCWLSKSGHEHSNFF